VQRCSGAAASGAAASGAAASGAAASGGGRVAYLLAGFLQDTTPFHLFTYPFSYSLSSFYPLRKRCRVPEKARPQLRDTLSGRKLISLIINALRAFPKIVLDR
jgi:hypothetical protein